MKLNDNSVGAVGQVSMSHASLTYERATMVIRIIDGRGAAKAAIVDASC